jgi:8-oxo-dGTP pyrophosphatase MutT (NUDIX family)
VDVTGEVVRAAGGLVTRPATGGGVEVLVVHRPRYDDWSLPKGKAEPGESDEDAALREVEEETGYRCTLGTELPTVHYEDRRGRQKQVRFWRMTAGSGDTSRRGKEPAFVANDEQPFVANDEPPFVANDEPPFVANDEPPFVANDEVDERRWISPTAAATLLSYDADRRLVHSLGGTDALPAPL